MATTAVFAEILIIGLQVEAWLVLLLLTAFGPDWVDFGAVGDFAALVTVLVLALAYVLGIVADRLADTAFGLVDKPRRDGLPAKVATMRMTVMHESDGMSRFLEYQRSRWRIARATVPNVLLAGIAVAAYLLVRTDDDWWALLSLMCAAALVSFTYFAAVRIQDAFIKRLVDAYTIVREKT
jgi:hypothetical protein